MKNIVSLFFLIILFKLLDMLYALYRSSRFIWLGFDEGGITFLLFFLMWNWEKDINYFSTTQAILKCHFVIHSIILYTLCVYYYIYILFNNADIIIICFKCWNHNLWSFPNMWRNGQAQCRFKVFDEFCSFVVSDSDIKGNFQPFLKACLVRMK